MSHGLRPDQVVKYLRSAISGVVGQNKGKLEIAKDPWHVLQLLAESPAGFRCIVHWAGDKPLGDREDAPLVTSRIDVIVSFNLGLAANAESALVDESAINARPSLLKLVDAIRKRIVAKRWPADQTDTDIRYLGCDPVETADGIPLAAYRLAFELDHAIPEYDSEAAGNLDA